MVVKPLNFIAEGKRGITQPAIKCRGAEYLRIIYGPEYLLPGILNGCVRGMSEPSGLSQAESLHLVSRRWSDLFARSPYGSLMSAFSEFWLWKVSRLTHDYSYSRIRAFQIDQE